MEKEKKIKEQEWLKGLSLEEFRNVWCEWYIPALRNVSHIVQGLNKKLDEIIERLSNETASKKTTKT